MSEETPTPRTRRLAAILHADVAGYTTLMSADEAATQAALSAAIRRARAVVAARRGRMAGTAGDAFLAEFSSVTDAVRAALDFQKRPPGDGTQLAFRIGVNLGDVIVEGDDIFGEGINLAARVQALAPPGGIAITDAVHAQLGSRIDVGFTDGGTHQVKNVAHPVHIHVAGPFAGASAAPPAPRARRRLGLAAGIAAAALAAVLGTAALLHRAPGPATPAAPGAGLASEARPVAAVLPFIEAGARDTWFADGITEDVIAHLGRFPGILVLSWNAVSEFRSGAPALDTLRDELGARYVLAGSIRRGGGRLRLSVELSDARDGLLLWSKRFEAPSEDVFELQDRITGAVAGSLALNLARAEQRRALEAEPQTLDAYELVLRGRARSRRVGLADNAEARALFEQALGKDPHYADALAGLAWTHLADVWWGWSESPFASLERAAVAADRALAEDPSNVRALTVRSEAFYLSQQHEPARAACDRALEINPNDPSALAMCGSVRIFTGAPEAGVALLELALRIDPEPASWALTNLSLGQYLLGAYERAADTLGRGARGFDEDPAPHAVLAAVNARLGRPEAARREVQKTLRLYPFFSAEVFANNIGNSDRARALLEDLRAAGFE